MSPQGKVGRLRLDTLPPATPSLMCWGFRVIVLCHRGNTKITRGDFHIRVEKILPYFLMRHS